MQELRASLIACGETDGVLFASFAEGEEPEDFCLHFQRARQHDEQDRELGMDTYCLVTNRGTTHYGGVAAAALGPRQLEVFLTSGAAGRLGIPDSFVIKLASTPPPELASTLRAVLGAALTESRL